MRLTIYKILSFALILDIVALVLVLNSSGLAIGYDFSVLSGKINGNPDSDRVKP